MVGEKFNRLLVLEDLGIKKTGAGSGRTWWLCKCECGIEKAFRAGNVIRGRTRSCGCLRTELMIERTSLPNNQTQKNFVLSQMKKQSKSRSLEWGISDDCAFSLMQQPCYYCGSPAGNTCTINKRKWKYNGIDRLDSKIGYRLDNIVPACGVCNKMKRAMPHDQFIDHIKLIIANMGEK